MRARRMRRPYRRVVPLEKVEQQHGVRLLTMLGAHVYILGTRRPKGKPCPKCGTFVPEYQGTCQTPGIADVYALLPNRIGAPPLLPLWWECKAEDGGPSPAQVEFRDRTIAAGLAHVVGPCNALIAWLVNERYLRADQVPHYRLSPEVRA